MNGSSFHWEMQSEKCFTQSSPDSSCILIYIGWSAAEIILTTTDSYGCVTTCMTTLECEFVLDRLLLDTDSGTTLPSEFNTAEINSEVPLGENLQHLRLYPNPTSGSLTISFESESDDQVEFNFMNLLGQVILSDKMNAKQGFNSNSLNVSHVPEGSYLMQIKTQREIQTRVVVILRDK